MSCGDGGGAGVNGWSVAVTVRELVNKGQTSAAVSVTYVAIGRRSTRVELRRCWGAGGVGTAGTCLHRVGSMPVLLYNLISCQCRFFCK
jgi:hypothetical protein